MASTDLVVPSGVLQELPAEEPVFRSAPARLAPSPGSPRWLAGTAVLTAARLSFVPGEDAPRREQSNDPIRILVGELWQLVRPAVLEAFPLAQLIAARQRAPSTLAGRGRPGIEVPLQMLEGVFAAGASPGWLGFTIALAPDDPRPAFSLYLDLGPSECGEWLGLLERAGAAAVPRPDLERPYALYYLFRPLPTPWVWIGSGKAELGRGKLMLAEDGPALTRRPGEVLLPYETVDTVEIAHATKWRSGSVALVKSDGFLTFLAPRRDMRALEDCAHLIAEISGAAITHRTGPLAAGRIVFRAAWMSTAAAGLAELAHILFF
ncbi:MAG: hypothetical protein HYY06_30755 [Deltaproteobacteria bacterium]|nr:hypothetical protein [Deltaproteobacteria bacterium]